MASKDSMKHRLRNNLFNAYRARHRVVAGEELLWLEFGLDFLDNLLGVCLDLGCRGGNHGGGGGRAGRGGAGRGGAGRGGAGRGRRHSFLRELLCLFLWLDSSELGSKCFDVSHESGCELGA